MANSDEMTQSTLPDELLSTAARDVRVPTVTVIVLDGRYAGALAYAMRSALARPSRIEVVHLPGTPAPVNLPIDVIELFDGPIDALSVVSGNSDVLVVQVPEGILERMTDSALKRLRADTRCLLLEVDEGGEIVRASGPLSWIAEESSTEEPASERSPVVTVGVDASPASAIVTRWAADEAIRRDATLRVVAVHPRDGHAADAERALRDACAHTVGAVIEVVIAEGEPIDVLVQQSLDSDLLVVGAHGTSGLIHSAMGGVGDSCSRLAACPVVIVPVKSGIPQVGTDQTTRVPPSAA